MHHFRKLCSLRDEYVIHPEWLHTYWVGPIGGLVVSSLRGQRMGFDTWWCHQMETFSALLAICAGNSPHKGQWRGALMFTVICARINGWVNNREAGDLRRYRAHCDVTVMTGIFCTAVTLIDWMPAVLMPIEKFSSRHSSGPHKSYGFVNENSSFHIIQNSKPPRREAVRI